MESSTIIRLNVGGEIFLTSIFTLMKYSDSVLAKMFDHVEQRLSPTAKTKDQEYFLDADPKYFKVVLNFLRMNIVLANDVETLEGALNLAHYFGLDHLILILQHKLQTNLLQSQAYLPEMVVLDFRGQKTFKIMRKKLTRVPDSVIAR